MATLAVSREYGADAGAAAITGDPASLAAALARLEARQRVTPSQDLRERADVVARNVGPVDPGGLLRTHPPTQTRIERLRDAAAAA